MALRFPTLHLPSFVIPLLLLLLLSATITSTHPSPLIDPSPRFSILALRSGNDGLGIHQNFLTAAASLFWIGKPTSYNNTCPEAQAPCPNGTETVLKDGGYFLDSALLFPTSSPAFNFTGQEIYIRHNGALSFTAPGSGAAVGGYRVGRFNASFESVTSVLGEFTFLECVDEGEERDVGWWACPKGQEEGEEEGGAVYQVFANVTGVDAGECVGFGAATVRVVGERSGAEVWEYL